MVFATLLCLCQSYCFIEYCIPLCSLPIFVFDALVYRKHMEMFLMIQVMMKVGVMMDQEKGQKVREKVPQHLQMEKLLSLGDERVLRLQRKVYMRLKMFLKEEVVQS